MKQYIITGLVAAGALVALPALAQKEKEGKKDKEMQTIVITRDGDVDGKTLIEIDGNKVKINGKDADKNTDVNVNVTTVKKGGRISVNGIGGNNTWVFSDDGRGGSYFTEDENRAMLGVITDLCDKGAKITSITEQSAAEKAGLKTGDIITKINKEAVKEDGDVARAIKARKPGDKVTVTFLRDEKEQTVTAELGKWKGFKMQSFGGAHPLNLENFRVTVPPTPPMPPLTNYYISSGRQRLGLSIQDTEDGKGVKVTDVDEETPAASAGFLKDDLILQVDEEPVNSTDELKRITARARQGSTFSFKISRKGKEQTLEVKYPRKLKTADL